MRESPLQHSANTCHAPERLHQKRQQKNTWFAYAIGFWRAYAVTMTRRGRRDSRTRQAAVRLIDCRYSDRRRTRVTKRSESDSSRGRPSINGVLRTHAGKKEYRNDIRRHRRTCQTPPYPTCKCHVQSSRSGNDADKDEHGQVPGGGGARS